MKKSNKKISILNNDSGVIRRESNVDRRESNVDKIVHEEIGKLISQGKYVEYDTIRRNCELRLQSCDYAQQQRQLSLDPTLRSVQEFNLEVNSVVDAYYYLTPIKIFHDCEKFVVERMEKWFKNYKKNDRINGAEKFTDFFYGEFHQVPRVKKLFKCSQLNPPLVYISKEEVVDIFMDIVMGNTSKPNSQHIGGQVRGEVETEYIDFPVNFNIGGFIGTGGSNVKKLAELTSCSINVEKTRPKIKLQGTRDCINDAKQRILSGNPTVVDYQEKFQKILDIRLQMKWSAINSNEMNYPHDANTGVIVDAKSLHSHLSSYWTKLSYVYDLKSKEFAKKLSERVTTQWENWFGVRSFCMLFV